MEDIIFRMGTMQRSSRKQRRQRREESEEEDEDAEQPLRTGSICAGPPSSPGPKFLFASNWGSCSSLREAGLSVERAPDGSMLRAPSGTFVVLLAAVKDILTSAAQRFSDAYVVFDGQGNCKAMPTSFLLF